MMAKRTRRLVTGLVVLATATVLVWLSLDSLGGVLFRRGMRAKQDWNLTTAVKYFNWARRLQRSGIPATLELGLCQQLRGDFFASQNELLPLVQTIKDSVILSRAHNAIGVNHYSFNEPDAAIASHQRALDFARQAANRRLEAEALIDLSRAFYHSKGKFNEALANLEQARSIARELSDERTEAAALRNIGVVYWWFKGELDRPLKDFYFPALELYRRQNDQRGAATMLSLIALVFNNKGDVYRFMQYQNESIEIQERIGDQAGMSDSLMHMGILYGGMGNYRKARECYGKSLELTRRIGYRLAQNDLEALLAGVQVNLEEYDEAIKLYDPLLNHKTKDSVQFNVFGVAYSYQLKGDYAQALSLYQRALQAHARGTTPDIRFEVSTLVQSAECAIALGDWKRAAEFMTRVDEIMRSLETHSSGQIEAAIVRAKLARHDDRRKQALTHLQEALEIESRIFASASTNALIPPHRRSYDSLYDLLLGFSSDSDKTISNRANELVFAFLENMRYRSLRNFLVQVKEKRVGSPLFKEKERDLTERINKLLSRLKQHDDMPTRTQLRKAYDEYENLTLKAQLEQPQYLAIRAARPATLAEIQNNISSETALVEFLFVGEKVFALVVTKSALHVVPLTVSKGALAAKVKLFRSLIFSNEEKEAEWLPVAESLRASLIAPIETKGSLNKIHTIGFVPYAFLHDLPFAALARRGEGRVEFLVEHYALFQTPSATFQAKTSASESAYSSTNLPPGEDVTIAFGRGDFSREKLPTLAFAAEEAAAVSQTTAGKAFTNNQATETELKRLAYNCDYLHLTTHAIAESEMPLLSRLLLEPTDADDGSLTVREIFELGLRSKLVTLSACETGQSFAAGGTDFIEQDRIGLIEAFLHAGSHSVLATLLPVSDQPTTEFMKRFYGELRSNRSKVEALAAAQRAMLRGEIAPAASTAPESPPFTHPRYWAPFILVGDLR